MQITKLFSFFTVLGQFKVAKYFLIRIALSDSDFSKPRYSGTLWCSYSLYFTLRIDILCAHIL